jgi:hypothetical protein
MRFLAAVVRIMAGILALGNTAAGPAETPLSLSPGDWPMPAHDRTLSNRSPLKCDLQAAPRKLWQLNTAVWTGDVEVVADGQKQTLTLDTPLNASTPIPTRMLDVSGSGKPVPVADGYWARLLPQVKGLQRVAWTSTWGDTPSRLQCFSYEQGLGHPKLEWETPPEQTVYAPQTCIADVNGDGKQEVVCSLHYRTMVFDGQTGKKLHELRYHHLRNYGFFGLFFEPGDSYAKFVNISDFAHHFDVLDFNGGDMTVAFRRDVQGVESGGITRSSKIVRPGPNPLEDLDGDGHVEMTFNLFNDQGDNMWHVMSYEPLTGTVKLNLKGQYLVGLYDVDGCGHPELLCQSVSDRNTTGWTTLKVLKLRNGKVETLQTIDNARFATFDLTYLPPTVDTGAAGGRTTAAAGRIGAHGEPGFLLLRPGTDLRPCRAEAYVRQGGRFIPAWSVAAPPDGTLAVYSVEGRNAGDTLASGKPARVVFTVSGPQSHTAITLAGAQGQPRNWNAAVRSAPAPIVVSSRGRPYLITENSNDRVAAYALSPERKSPKLLWQRPGRGMADGSGVTSGLAAGDIEGRGEPAVVFAEQDPKTGAAALVATDLSGHDLWRHVFAGYDSDRPLWNLGGLTFWTLAHLTDPRRLDVYVNTRRSTMHSDVSFALDGRTGAQLWTGDAVPIHGVPTWGFGGTPVACVDFVGNGLEQIVSEYPVCYYVVDGRNGHFLHTVDLAAQTVLPGWAAYGRPLVADFSGDGKRQVLVPSPYVTGLLTREGKAIWSAPTHRGESSVTGCQVGDFDGDGKREVARLWTSPSPSAPPSLELLDGATGKEKGAPFVQDGMTLAGAVVADVDGDGADELVCRIAPKTLGALRLRGGVPKLLWQVSLPAEPVTTLVADLDGSGKGTLVVSCADGSILALGR